LLLSKLMAHLVTGLYDRYHVSNVC